MNKQKLKKYSLIAGAVVLVVAAIAALAYGLVRYYKPSLPVDSPETERTGTGEAQSGTVTETDFETESITETFTETQAETATKEKTTETTVTKKPTQPPVTETKPPKGETVGEVFGDFAEISVKTQGKALSDPIKTPLIKGTMDAIVGSATIEGDKYYQLKSGFLVQQEKVRILGNRTLSKNRLQSVAEEDGDKSKIVLKTDWKVPFQSELKPQSYYAGFLGRKSSVDKFTATYIDFMFCYTPQASGEFDLSGSNVVKSAEWVNVGKNGTSTLRVHLQKTGVFYGYTAQYDGDRLIISFNNNPNGVRGAVIMLDPGHGGRDSGAIGVNGTYESGINFKIAKTVKKELENRGAKVIFTRTGDVELSLDDRQAAAKKSKADLFVSIHCNSSEQKSLSGTEVYYYRCNAKPLAASVHKELASVWKSIYAGNPAMQSAVVPKDGGVRFSPFRVTRIEECPAILLETGYLSHASECAMLCKPENQDKFAKAIADGICHFLENN